MGQSTTMTRTLIFMVICCAIWQANGIMPEESLAEKRGGWQRQPFFRQQRQQPRNLFRASKRGGNYFRASKREPDEEDQVENDWVPAGQGWRLAGAVWEH